ncbi:MAG: PEP-CTERM sorting domain-containing protein [Fimbriimonadaceae bacterium]|nr:PEP-CTERM sorting domain-containing protein [Fimbriimonadaceae bacterium]
MNFQVRSLLVCFTAVLSATLCQRAVAASLFNHIGDLAGDPQALQYVPQGGTPFSNYYTGEAFFFDEVFVANPGGNNLLTDWWEVRGAAPDTAVPWDAFPWQVTIHSTREAAIANPREGDLGTYNVGLPQRVSLSKLDRNGRPVNLLHFSDLALPLLTGWYSFRHLAVDNYFSGVVEGTYSDGTSSDTFIPWNSPSTYVRDSIAHQYSGYLNVAASYAPVPEPATLAGLGLGALALFRRRRHSMTTGGNQP